jgi:hypothetical protein
VRAEMGDVSGLIYTVGHRAVIREGPVSKRPTSELWQTPVFSLLTGP